MTKMKVKKDQLKSMIESDSGENLLRKAKLAVRFVNNHRSSSWVEMVLGKAEMARKISFTISVSSRATEFITVLFKA
jgi:hypothetical protein